MNKTENKTLKVRWFKSRETLITFIEKYESKGHKYIDAIPLEYFDGERLESALIIFSNEK